MKKINKNKTVSYGYVGRWHDGSLGWVMPKFLSDNYGPKHPAVPRLQDNPFVSAFEDVPLFEKCKITIEVVKNKKGKAIRRRIK
jgi:hypothetical protein